MNIMLITTSLTEGGAERVAARLASALCERHNVRIVCIWPQGNENGYYPVDVRAEVIPLYLPNPFHTLQWEAAWYLARLRQRRIAIRELKEKYEIDVCISFMTLPNFDNVRSRANEKTIISVRNIMRPPIKKFWLWRLMDRVQCTYAGKKADLVVTVSRNVGAEQARHFRVPKKKIRTIYNPIDADFIRDASKKPVNDPGFEAFRASHEQIIITMGRLVEQKGHRHLIRAFSALRKKLPGAGLVILGKGYLEESLKSLVSSLDLSEHVFFPGFQKDPFPYLGKADLFVMSSLFEGFSNAMLEAMACGLPLVACDCNSGPRELLAPDTDPGKLCRDIEKAPYGILTPVCSGKQYAADDAGDALADGSGEALAGDSGKKAAKTHLSRRLPAYKKTPGKAADPLEREEKLLAKAMWMLLADAALREHYTSQSALRIRDFSTENILAGWEELFREA